MPRKRRDDAGKRWTVQEEALLRAVWRTRRALGDTQQEVADEIGKRLGRTRGSVLGKADLMGLTISAAKLKERR